MNCESVIWSLINKVSITASGSGSRHTSSPDGKSSCESSYTFGGAASYERPTLSAMAACCGCNYAITIPGHFGDDMTFPWSMTTTSNGTSTPTSGNGVPRFSTTILFRSNPSTGRCEFSIACSGGAASGYEACFYPDDFIVMLPWTPLTAILGTHGIGSSRSGMNGTDTNSTFEDSIAFTVTIA